MSLEHIRPDANIAADDVWQENQSLKSLIAAMELTAIFIDSQYRVMPLQPDASPLSSQFFGPFGIAREMRLADLAGRLGQPGIQEDVEGALCGITVPAREMEIAGRWYTVRALPQRTDGRPIDGVNLTFLDITDRMNSERAFRASEERAAFVRKSSGVGFWYCDLPFGDLQWDELVKSHFHLPPDAPVTIHTFYDCIHPDDRLPTQMAIETSIQNHTPYDTAFRTVDPVGNITTWIRAIGRTFYAEDGTPTRFDGITMDISEQKRAEEEVTRLNAASDRQRRLYETILASIGDFVYVFSLDHRVIYANDALIKMWDRGHEGAIGKTFLEIGYEPWHAEMHDREIDQVRTTRQPLRGEVPFRGAYGERQYEYIFVPVIGADGEVEAVAGTTRDITERKQTEDQLRRNHDTFYSLIQNNPFGVYAVDADFRLRQVSLGAQKAFESVNPLLGRDFAEVVHAIWPEPFASEIITHFRNTLETGNPHSSVSTIERRADTGELESYDWRIERVSLPDGRHGVVCYFYDLSERHRWEATLRESEERLRLATEAAELGIWTWQPAFDRVAWENDRPHEILGVPRSRPPVTCAEFKNDFLHPDDLESFNLAFDRTAELRVPLGYQCRIRRPDGEFRWIQFTGRVADGEEPLRLIGTVQDVTDYTNAIEDLRQADRRKDEFLATLAHELRNPLSPIRSGLELMSLTNYAPEAVSEASQIIDRQISHMMRLVDDLMDVSRINSGKLVLQRERVLLSSVVDSAVESIRPLIDLMKHQLSIQMPPSPVMVEVDPTRMAQVLANLLNNAAKYTDPGGSISLVADISGGDLVVTVRDSGVGIAADQLPHVFEMFSQVNTTLGRSQGGLGIGLMLVQRLVAIHGGTVEASSAGLGHGAQFVLRLPNVVDTPQSAQAPDAQPAPLEPTVRFLVVDDNPDVAYVLTTLLRMHGNAAQAVHSGEEALTVMGEFCPDVVLLDIGLPMMDGYEVCRQIRKLPGGDQVTIIAQSGWGSPADRLQSKEAGFDHHLVKPVEMKTLLKLLERSA